MVESKFTFFLLLLPIILIDEGTCGCSTSEFPVFVKCFIEYSHSEFAKKPFTKWADVEKTCKDFWISQQCMGHSVINHCANTNGFTKYTQSREDGAQMAAQYWHLNFICGRGHQAGKNIFQCLLDNFGNCYMSNCTCDVLQETINVCSKNTQKHCGQDGYDYLYGTLATGRCHLNPECDFLQDHCGEISDYANAPSKNEKLHNEAVLQQRTGDPETDLIARIISAEEVSIHDLNKFIPKTVRLLKESTKDQFATAWILRSLTRLSLDFTHLVVDENAIPVLIKLLDSTDIDLQEQVILALGNIIGSDPEFRDQCIQHGIIDPLSKILNSPHSQIQAIRHTAWVVMNILRHDDLSLSYTDMDKILSALSKFIEYDDTFILIDTFSGLWAFSNRNSSNIQQLIDQGIAKSVIGHLSHANPKIQVGALRTVIDLATGNEEQVKYLVHNGVLKPMHDLLKINEKHSIFFLNSIIANHHEYIQEFFDAGFIPLIVSGLIRDTVTTQINSLYGIHSIVIHGTTNQTIKLIHMNIVFNLCNFLAQLDPENVKDIRIILRIINEMFKKDAKYHNKIAEEIYDSDGLDVLERLQKHEDKEIRELATAFYKPINENFSYEEDLKQNLHDEF